MYIVYLLTWPRSPLIYVGRTSDPSTRLRAHKKTLKYLGLGAPNMEVLESSLTESQAYVAEQRWIEFLNSTTLGREVLVPRTKPIKIKAAVLSKRKRRQ